MHANAKTSILRALLSDLKKSKNLSFAEIGVAADLDDQNKAQAVYKALKTQRNISFKLADWTLEQTVCATESLTRAQTAMRDDGLNEEQISVLSGQWRSFVKSNRVLSAEQPSAADESSHAPIPVKEAHSLQGQVEEVLDLLPEEDPSHVVLDRVAQFLARLSALPKRAGSDGKHPVSADDANAVAVLGAQSSNATPVQDSSRIPPGRPNRKSNRRMP